MAMLPAPIIEGTLPAFYSNEQGDFALAVPYSMSRAVSSTEFDGFCIKMKSITSNVILYNSSTTIKTNSENNKQEAVFNLSKYGYEPTAVKENKYKPSTYYTWSNNQGKYILATGAYNSKTTYYQRKELIQVGNFYKVQIAYFKYLNEQSGLKEVGYYSTVGVIKYTTRPEVRILKLEDGNNNGHIYNYTGTYSQEAGDVSEKEYSYRFIIKEGEDNIVEDTGYIIHNTSNNSNHYESQDEFYYPNELEANKIYRIQYKVRTNNGLEISSPDYRLTSKKTAATSLNTSITAVNNYEEGYIQVSLQGKIENEAETLAIGSFKILKASEKYDFTDWKEIFNFNLVNQPPSIISWRDYTIEQGATYKYAIQQYNNKGIYSDKILSNEVYADFEDIFLFDGERQLKIKYNPKVSSFKHTLLESKMDTLGSKYPFVFRNGNVGYKEFPINGLLSYHMDDQGDFFDNKKLYNYEYRTSTGKLELLKKYPDEATFLNNCHIYYHKDNSKNKYYKLSPDVDWKIFYQNGAFRDLYEKEKIYFDVNKERAINTSFSYASTNLDSINYQVERDFKLEVLEWLNNGKPKLFRSPSEGNYIIRLMNVSLSPNDTLGRMLHTFQATAYEVAENTYTNWIENNFIKTTANSTGGENSYFKMIYSDFSAGDKRTKLGEARNYVYFKFQDLMPGTQVGIRFVGETGDVRDPSKRYIIGSTGTYEAPIPVNWVYVQDAIDKKQGAMIAGYYEDMENEDHFADISDILYGESVSEQFIGPIDNLMDENHIQKKNINIALDNGEIVKGDIKVSIFSKIRIYRRPIIKDEESECYYPLQLKEIEGGHKDKDGNVFNELDFSVELDDIKLELADNINYLEHKNFDIVPQKLSIGSGVYVELFYQYQTLVKKE